MPPHVRPRRAAALRTLSDRGTSCFALERGTASCERSCPGIRTASRSAARPARRTCCSRPAPARRSRRRAACATANFSSLLTSAAISHPVRGPPSASCRNRPDADRQPHRARLADPTTSSEIVHRFDATAARVRACAIDRYDALVLARAPGAGRSRDRRGAARRRLARPRSARAMTPRCCAGCVSPGGGGRRRRSCAPPRTARAARRGASRAAHSRRTCRARSIATRPRSLLVPSGRHTALIYNDDGSVSASVKLQELFGLAETPRVGRQREAGGACRCSRRTAARSRSRAICAASGIARIRRCERNCAAAIRSIRGRRIRGRPRLRREPRTQDSGRRTEAVGF